MGDYRTAKNYRRVLNGYRKGLLDLRSERAQTTDLRDRRELTARMEALLVDYLSVLHEVALWHPGPTLQVELAGLGSGIQLLNLVDIATGQLAEVRRYLDQLAEVKDAPDPVLDQPQLPELADQ